MTDRDPVPVVSAILVDGEGRVLMQLRDDAPQLYPRHWTLPGGYVEQGETPEEAIRRELREEMELEDLDLTHWQARNLPRAEFMVRQHFFIGPLPRPPEAITLHEGDALRVFSKAELEGLKIAFHHEQILEAFFGIDWGANIVGAA